MSDQLHVGVAGLHFGSAFLPIYQRHPAIREVSIADTDPDRLAWAGDTFGVRRQHASLDGLLADPDVDAIHLLTPVSYHAQQSVAVLRALGTTDITVSEPSPRRQELARRLGARVVSPSWV